jgi:RNA polymerase sigma-70 factor (ECF subfamily)
MTPADDLGRLIQDVAARQDRAAFARLFEHFAPRVKGYLMRCGAPADLAEEIAQETMASVWRKAAFFDPARGGASTWVFTIARNLRIDHARRRRAPDAYEPDPTEEPASPASTEDVMIAVERDARVQAALAALSPEQAAIVKLSFFVEKPHPEIARELGIPLGTVKSRVRLALKRLRALLDDLP